MSAMPSAQKPEGKPPRVTRCARLPGRQVSMIPDRNAPDSMVTNVHLPDVDEVFAAQDAYAVGFMAGLRNAAASATSTSGSNWFCAISG